MSQTINFSHGRQPANRLWSGLTPACAESLSPVTSSPRENHAVLGQGEMDDTVDFCVEDYRHRVAPDFVLEAAPCSVG
jgi:hypothetical protein